MSLFLKYQFCQQYRSPLSVIKPSIWSSEFHRENLLFRCPDRCCQQERVASRPRRKVLVGGKTLQRWQKGFRLRKASPQSSHWGRMWVVQYSFLMHATYQGRPPKIKNCLIRMFCLKNEVGLVTFLDEPTRFPKISRALLFVEGPKSWTCCIIFGTNMLNVRKRLDFCKYFVISVFPSSFGEQFYH